MWYEMQEEFVILAIKAQPNASKNKIAGLYDDSLKITIKAPAVEGAANKELIKFLSKTFKVPKSSITFIGGETSKRKRIKLPRTKLLEKFIASMEES